MYFFLENLDEYRYGFSTYICCNISIILHVFVHVYVFICPSSVSVVLENDEISNILYLEGFEVVSLYLL